MTERVDGYAPCDSCNVASPYYIVHNGFNESSYGYCDSCGLTAFFGTYSERPQGAPYRRFERISKDVEPFLRPCECGGRFSAAATPRCPNCRTPFSPVAAAEWIEKNARGTAGGWKWQRTWDGLYAVVIRGRVVDDPWLWDPDNAAAHSK